MDRKHIAIQFYTLREQCRTLADFTETCRKVREIGYEALQLSGVPRNVVSLKDAARICADHGLTICATHESPEDILERPEQVVENLNEVGATITAYPMPKGIDLNDAGQLAAFIDQLNQSGRVLAEQGKVLTYHNHHVEFMRVGGRLILDQIFEDTNPAWVQGEPDTYWIQYGGGDPVAWCRKLANRMPLIHLKDYRINAERQIEFSEVGAGNLDFPAIIDAARQSGCQWYIVEQDTCVNDPFDAIRTSFDYLASVAL